jgi:hypothetical protein
MNQQIKTVLIVAALLVEVNGWEPWFKKEIKQSIP